MYHKGKYILKNPGKYAGNPNAVVYRSSWERTFFIWADMNESVVCWSSEELSIPYRCATDGRIHQYWPDVILQVVDKGGQIKTYMVEIKPKKQTKRPRRSKNKKRYLQEVMTYGKNVSKWKAAENYCLEKGWEFRIVTEDHLNMNK